MIEKETADEETSDGSKGEQSELDHLQTEEGEEDTHDNKDSNEDRLILLHEDFELSHIVDRATIVAAGGGIEVFNSINLVSDVGEVIQRIIRLGLGVALNGQEKLMLISIFSDVGESNIDTDGGVRFVESGE